MLRVLVVIGGALLTMLVVIGLRAETTRLNYEASELDHRASQLLQELRDKELELARLKNPVLIRARVSEFRLNDSPPKSPEARTSAGPERRRR